MSFGLLNSVMLAGLGAVALPLIIHLLNRRRHEVIDWGAMQFLTISTTRRRRLLIEDVLLMLLRMALIALMVLGLAAPFVEAPSMAHLGGRPNRDLVFIVDGSYSMGYTGSGSTPRQAAQDWALSFLDELITGDGVALLQAGPQVIPVIAEPTTDLALVRQKLADLPALGGTCDWPAALRQAFRVLSAQGRRPRRDIVILTDGQRQGWSDESSLFRWEMLAHELRDQGGPARPQVWVVNLDPDRPSDPPNWSLAPLRAGRAVAAVQQEVKFRSALVIHGQDTYKPPHRLRLEIDGKPARDLEIPTATRPERGQVPLTFTHRFQTAGTHLVSLIVEPDPPPDQRPADYRVKDHLPGDNRQDIALEVLPTLPVLLIDGAAGQSVAKPRARDIDFLVDALAPARDPTPVLRVRVIPISDFEPALLERDLDSTTRLPAGKPRVLVLANIARLTAAQQDAVSRFLADGGGVLVTLGHRADPTFYNEQLFHAGQGWLPARLDGISETPADKPATPLPSPFFDAELDLFGRGGAGGLSAARFQRWWKLTTPGREARAAPVALLSTQDPWLVDGGHRGGRVLLTAFPFDKSWQSNLPDLPEFVLLAHELIYYLAAARGTDFNLAPGQPLRYRLALGEAPDALQLLTPDGLTRRLAADPNKPSPGQPTLRLIRSGNTSQAVFDDTRTAGVYRMKSDARTTYFTVQPDPRESDLTPATDAERKQVAAFVPMTYESDRAALTTTVVEAGTETRELWWWVLSGVVILLCAEVWLTRRIVMSR
jgi:hypothetical protein